MFPLLNSKFTYQILKKTNKIYCDGFVNLPLHIYRRHSSPPVRKTCPIRNIPLQAKILSSLQTKRFKRSYSKIYTLLNPIFGKYLEPRKELTRFARSKPMQTCYHDHDFHGLKQAYLFFLIQRLKEIKQCREKHMLTDYFSCYKLNTKSTPFQEEK